MTGLGILERFSFEFAFHLLRSLAAIPRFVRKVSKGTAKNDLPIFVLHVFI